MFRVLLFAWLSALSAVAQSEGILATIAGSTGLNAASARGFGGDGGPARKALFSFANPQNDCDPAQYDQISHVSVDAAGNLYITDSANQRIRRVSVAGIITTIAGNGEKPPVDSRTCVPAGGAVLGDGGPATAARLHYPAGIAIDSTGAIVFADQQNNRIRRIAPNGGIATIAGNGLHVFYAPNVPALNSGLDWPTAIAIDAAGLVYFSELHSGRVARIGADGRLTTVAGTGIPGYNSDSGGATSIRLSNPTGLAFDAAGNLYIADQGNNRVRKVTPGGSLTTLDIPQLSRPADVKVDAKGNIYVSDMLNHRVRRVDPTGVVSVAAGDGIPVRGADGIAAPASSLNLPTGLAVDAKGDVLVIDWGNCLVRRVTYSNAPVMRTSAIVNGASFTAPLAPGILFSIFGAGLDNATVSANGEPAHILFTSPTQINAQLPYSATVGEARIEVATAIGRSPAEFVPAADSAIGVFTFAPSRRAIVLNQDNSINALDAPESRGRVLTVFLTGIGAVNPPIATGAAASLSTLHYAVTPATATLGGAEAQVSFLGLTPGFIGLAQANILIPDSAPSGAEVPLLIRAAGQMSNATVVSIR